MFNEHAVNDHLDALMVRLRIASGSSCILIISANYELIGAVDVLGTLTIWMARKKKICINL